MSARPAPRVTKAARRYRPGKAPQGAGESYSSSSSDEDGQSPPEERESETDERKALPLGHGYAPIRSQPAQLDSSEDESDTGDEEEKEEVIRAAPVHDAETSSAEESSDDDESESSSSDDAPIPLMMSKPIFKSKKERETAAAAPSSSSAIAIERIVVDDRTEQGDDEKTSRQVMQKRESHALAAARIKQELRQNEERQSKPDLDDTDGLDPAAEFEAWREREQARLQRERQAEQSKDAERVERQRRANMSEQQLMDEDVRYARNTRMQKRKSGDDDGSGGGGKSFMQKYYHKGSFFQDSDLLKDRDFTATTESAVDKRLLPKMMQVRDYGKKGRSKHTHLRDQDTTLAAAGAQSTRSCFLCGGEHLRRDCPQSAERTSA